MNLDAQMIVSISEVSSNFSHVMHMADNYGCVVILKDNKPKYLLIDLEQESVIFDLTEEEKLEIAAKRNEKLQFLNHDFICSDDLKRRIL